MSASDYQGAMDARTDAPDAIIPADTPKHVFKCMPAIERMREVGDKIHVWYKNKGKTIQRKQRNVAR